MMPSDAGEDALRRVGGDGIESLTADDGGIRLRVRPAVLRAVSVTLRDHPELLYGYPADLCGTHTADEIHLWYRLWSHEHGRAAMMDVVVPSENPVVPSVSDIWPGFDWHERECFDMLGMRFDGHPRDGDPSRMRILLPEDWTGHPFRKDYKPVFTGDPLHGPQETN